VFGQVRDARPHAPLREPAKEAVFLLESIAGACRQAGVGPAVVAHFDNGARDIRAFA
jgi:hypothetical protein